jgi:hypothetical protein
VAAMITDEHWTWRPLRHSSKTNLFIAAFNSVGLTQAESFGVWIQFPPRLQTFCGSDATSQPLTLAACTIDTDKMVAKKNQHVSTTCLGSPQCFLPPSHITGPVGNFESHGPVHCMAPTYDLVVCVLPEIGELTETCMSKRVQPALTRETNKVPRIDRPGSLPTRTNRGSTCCALLTQAECAETIATCIGPYSNFICCVWLLLREILN